jgi:hypothetical protein
MPFRPEGESWGYAPYRAKMDLGESAETANNNGVWVAEVVRG